MKLCEVPLGSYGYLCNGDYFKLPNIAANHKSNERNRLSVILFPGTVAARMVELPLSLPIRKLAN